MNREPPGFLSALENWNRPRSGSGISLIPISAFCSTDTIRLLPPRWKGDRSKHRCSARQPILMMSNKPLVFPGGGMSAQNRAATPHTKTHRVQKHYRPTHGRVSALISTSAHPKPGQAPLTFRLMAQNRTPQADAFFLDFAINDDGERPELTKIMDDYFRKP